MELQVVSYLKMSLWDTYIGVVRYSDEGNSLHVLRYDAGRHGYNEERLVEVAKAEAPWIGGYKTEKDIMALVEAIWPYRGWEVWDKRICGEWPRFADEEMVKKAI